MPTDPKIQIRSLTELADFHACVTLQREIWNESDLETEPYVTFVVAAATGGQVLGAFDGSNMVGFTLGLVGVRDNSVYIHSHMTGVLDSYRNRRIGRQLKLFQREEALSRNIHLIEWTFDPLETRNAHFNFNRLGAISRRLIPNFYGITSSPLHRGLPTDRLVAEWQLDAPRPIAALNEQPDLDTQPADAITIQLASELEHWKKDHPGRLAEEQTRLREQFQSAFAKGYAATAVTISPQGSAYHLTKGPS